MINDTNKTTKKQRKQQAREQRVMEEVVTIQSSQKQQWFIMGIIVIGAITLGTVIFFKANQPAKPLPGIAVKQLETEHITDISGVTYTSNPPTSGKHFALWAKRGVYPSIVSDGYLIHSLEHGYIVISYNCGPLAKLQTSLMYKKGDPLTTMPTDSKASMEPFMPQNLPKDALAVPQSFTTPPCKQLVTNLKTFLDTYQRIVIVPRPNLDAPLVLTAWGRIEKFAQFDKEAMNSFIQAFHNAGPEQTME